MYAGFVTSLCGACGTSGTSRKHLEIRVTDHGAKADGITDDRPAIAAAIRLAAQKPGARVLFPRGIYRLKHVAGGELLALRGISDLVIHGDNALLSCNTPEGTTSIFKLTDCENVTIEGLAFHDEGADRAVKWKGAVAIYLTGYGNRGNRRIRVEDCSFNNMLSALMVNDRGGRRAGEIRLQALDIRAGYYGLSFQNNGDNVFATGIRCNDVKRSYFPYGVTNHHVELAADNNATGYTDVLIKCYGRETANLAIKLRSRGKRSGDAIVALEQQHPNDRGMIRDVRIDLEITADDCGLTNVIVMRALTPEGKVLRATRSRWQNIRLQGHVEYCENSTRLLYAGSVPDKVGTLVMGPPLFAQVDPAQVRGFKLISSTDRPVQP
ncbi:MAG TPA: glycosyl hydrolase family 28-related protein [Candidatus Eisenbacteria bacterium]|nr:glycosyl hydrolase family 28-related protein [Candidatus Eisenbacteria bacterium]